jgi:hypothetical protein
MAILQKKAGPQNKGPEFDTLPILGGGFAALEEAHQIGDQADQENHAGHLTRPVEQD